MLQEKMKSGRWKKVRATGERMESRYRTEILPCEAQLREPPPTKLNKLSEEIVKLLTQRLDQDSDAGYLD